ncbi:pilus assembly protein, partial [Escherichia coli]|nr:pilus assembly protein [Escherichia coli]
MTWSTEGTTVLEANNPAPFYLNIKELKIRGRSIKSPTYIPPFGEQSLSIPGSSVGMIQCRTVT